MYFCLKLPSASSWGCELKSDRLIRHVCHLRQPLREAVSWNPSYPSMPRNRLHVSLFVRLWVEILRFRTAIPWAVVSLFVRLWVEIVNYVKKTKHVPRQPLREAVSWNKLLKVFCQFLCGQPLREAVSWNNPYAELLAQDKVSLFVRLWVEMLTYVVSMLRMLSASSWGCELKYQPCIILLIS